MSALANYEELKFFIQNSKEVYTKGKHNRKYRKIISELRKDGIIFIPVGNYRYKRIEECTTAERDKYIRQEITSLRTQYFNTVKSVKNYMTDEHLRLLHEGGLF